MDINNNHSLMTERYRPTSLENFVGNENIKKTIQQYLDQGDIQNFIFCGPAGSGKTTLAKLIVKNLNCDYLYLNASDERGVDTVRDKIQGFASSATFKDLKIVVLDEFDFMTMTSQSMLRNIIETYSRTTRFIMTCNYIERVIDPIQSRCQVLKIIPPSKAEVANHLVKILNNENIKHTDEDLVLIVNKYYPDLRKCLNIIQLSNIKGVLTLDKEVLIDSTYHVQILKELKKTKPSFKDIRQIIANSGQNSFEDLFKFLYENVEVYLPKNEGMGVIYINEHQYQAQLSLDKEINIMSLIARIIEVKTNSMVLNG